jgi:hypothetical protein
MTLLDDLQDGTLKDLLEALQNRVNDLEARVFNARDVESVIGDVSLQYRAVDTSGTVRMIMSAINLLDEFGVNGYLLARDANGNAQFWVDADNGFMAAASGNVTIDQKGIRTTMDGIFNEYNNLNTGAGEIGFLEMFGHYGLSNISFHSNEQATVTNPDAETGDLTGWIGSAGVIASSAQAHGGTYSFKIPPTQNMNNSSPIPVSGKACLIDLWLYVDNAHAGDNAVTVGIYCYDGSGTLLGQVNMPDPLYFPGSWKRFAFVHQYLPGTVSIKIFIQNNAPNDIYIDDINLYDGYGYQTISEAGIAFYSDVTARKNVAIKGDLTMTGSTNLAGDPASALQAATKRYVDGKTGYALVGGAYVFSPAASSNYYFGGLPGEAPTTTSARARIYIPKDGTLTSARVLWFEWGGTAGSGENVTMNIIKDNVTTSPTLIQTIGNTNVAKLFSNTALNLAVVSGDYVEIQMVTPAWATPPTNIRLSVEFFINT